MTERSTPDSLSKHPRATRERITNRARIVRVHEKARKKQESPSNVHSIEEGLERLLFRAMDAEEEARGEGLNPNFATMVRQEMLDNFEIVKKVWEADPLPEIQRAPTSLKPRRIIVRHRDTAKIEGSTGNNQGLV